MRFAALPTVRMTLVAMALMGLATAARAQAPADFGDAPDNTLDPGIEAYPGVPGRFPTVRDTVNAAIPGWKGAHHLTVDQEWLAEPGVAAATTTEPDAKLIDLDEDDADVKIFCVAGCILQVRAARVGTEGPDATRYVNALVDLDRDGRWRSADPVGTWPREHVIVNKALQIPAGGSTGVVSGIFFLSSSLSRWVRVTITRQPIEVVNAMVAWDGSVPPAGLERGETEDHLVQPILAPPLDPPKEPISHFQLVVTPNPVPVPPGGGNFDVEVHRVRPPGAYTPVTGFILTLTGCQTEGIGDKLDVTPNTAGFVGSIVDDAGIITNHLAALGTSLAPTWTPVDPLPHKEAVAAFTGTYDPPEDHRFSTCIVSLELDPPGEVFAHDLAYHAEVPVRFLESSVADGDGDGVPDGGDVCPSGPRLREDLDGFADHDGCFDPDNDADRVPDTVDECPLDVEDLDGIADHDGCPEPSFFHIFVDVPLGPDADPVHSHPVRNTAATGPGSRERVWARPAGTVEGPRSLVSKRRSARDPRARLGARPAARRAR